MTNPTKNQLLEELDLSTISFDLWRKIGQTINPKTWDTLCFKTWEENVDSSFLASMSLEDWEKVALLLAYSDNWAYIKFKEYRIKM